MDAALVVAIVSGLIALGSVALTAYLQSRSRKEERELSREEEAAELLARYRDPLLDAAFQLQSRLWNICARGFLDVYLLRGDEDERRYAEQSTQWMLGQFLGWMEIVRREAQHLDLAETPQSHVLSPALEKVRGVLQDDGLKDRGFRVFSADQRAIGELMTADRANGGRPGCIGYAEFTNRLSSPDFDRWFGPVGEGLAGYANPADHLRLVHLQHSLIDLIDQLDPKHVRVPADKMGKLSI